jgi:hypothetical protein
VLTVCGLHDTGEMVPFDNTLESLSFTRTDGGYFFAFGKYFVNRNKVAEIFTQFEIPEFSKFPFRGSISLFKVTLHGLWGILHFSFAVSELECGISVRIHGFDLRHHIGLCMNDRACYSAAILVKYAGHSDLFAYYSFHRKMI